MPAELEVAATTDIPTGEGRDTRGQRRSGRPRRFDAKLGLASLTIACGLVLIGFALLRAVTGDDVTKLPGAVESISPVPDAGQVPSQTALVVDLADVFAGELRLDGATSPTIDLAVLQTGQPDPGTQVDVPAGVVFDPGSNTLTVHPGEEVGFDEFGVGHHQVTVVYWKLVDGRGPAARSYQWAFNVV